MSCIIKREHCSGFCLSESEVTQNLFVKLRRTMPEKFCWRQLLVGEQRHEGLLALTSPASVLWKSPSGGWVRGETLTGSLSNLLYLISALNQEPQSATSALQSQLHFSIQMSSCVFNCVCVWDGQSTQFDLCVGWRLNKSHRCIAWWVSSLFLVNLDS